MENGRCKACHSPAVPPRAANEAHVLPLGTLLDDGNVIVGDKLGGGGFGITYIARDKTYGLIALKEFFPNSCVMRQGLNVVPYADKQKHFESSKRDFKREVKHILNLKDHPHIVNVLFELEENNTCYYGMEFLRGQSLLQYLQKNGRMSPVDAFVLLEPVMDALSYMHKRDCLHRDIAPDNIYLRNDDRMPMKLSPCIIDFGAAFTDRESFTYVAPNVGKPGFSPPDQKYEVDKQGPFTDVYALCATYYFMITGKVPASSDSRIMHGARVIPPSQHVPGISPRIDEIILKGMELDTTVRTQSASEVRRQLRAELIDSSTPLMPSSVPIPDPTHTEMPKQEPKKKVSFLSLLSCLLEWLVFFGAAVLLTGTKMPDWLLIGFAFSFILNVAIMQLTSGSASLGQKLLGLRMETDKDPLSAQLMYCLLRSVAPVQLLAELLALATGKPPFTESISGLFTTSAKVDTNPTVPAPVVTEDPQPKTGHRTTASGPKKGPNLRCISGNMTGQVIPLENGCVIGKSAQPPYCIADDMAISRQHCSFHSKDGKWYVRDEGSKNGTFVNQKRADAKQMIAIKPGDIISIGHGRFVFQTPKER